eukprot:1161487-Pelagomonas_calceolata.AAC.4
MEIQYKTSSRPAGKRKVGAAARFAREIEFGVPQCAQKRHDAVELLKPKRKCALQSSTNITGARCCPFTALCAHSQTCLRLKNGEAPPKNLMKPPEANARKRCMTIESAIQLWANMKYKGRI